MRSALQTLFIIIGAIVFTVSTALSGTQPRLVVEIVLDQFPYEYLTRFRPYLGNQGFVRLMNEGATFANTFYAHANTSTGPGHAVLSTGAYGVVNGIVGNNWFDARLGKNVYCVSDSTVKIIGGKGQGRSPANLLTLSFGDRLRIATGFKGKVISLSNKDRAAILMGGKYANCALWMRDSAFVTSTYYGNDLPAWAKKLNASGFINRYFGKRWERSLPLSAYRNLDKDDVEYENGENGMGTAFPHRITGNDTTHITPSYYDAVLTSPFGSEILAAYARAAIHEEQLGKDDVTDLLCVSFSSTDYVGHHFGPHSWEMLELVVQTDRILANFLKYIDAEVGLSHCVVVLSSDHGVSQIPDYVSTASGRDVYGRVSFDSLFAGCERALTEAYGAPSPGKHWIAGSANCSVTFDAQTVAEHKLTVEQVSQTAVAFARSQPSIAAAYTRNEIEHLVPFRTLDVRMKNSYNRARCGDVTFAFQPLYVELEDHKGATHGQPYESDAHVPLIIRGGAVRPGMYYTPAAPADIAATLSALTGVEATPGCQGRILSEALKTN